MINGTCHLGEGDCSASGRLPLGWCQKHYQRVRKYGDPDTTIRIKGDDEARFWSKVDRRGDGECWPWTGGVDDGGYGVFLASGESRKAHVWAYEHFIGPVPPERPELDHACHTRDLACRASICAHRRCVNFLQGPGMHLEPVTSAENSRRAHRDGVSLADVAAYRLRWEAGEFIGALATEAGIGKSALHKRFREMNGPSPDGSRRASRRQHLTVEMVLALHVRYLAGENVGTLAAEIGCDRTTIYNRFRRMSLPVAG